MRQMKKFIGILMTCILSVTMTGCGNNFDASGYTEAILNLHFQGDMQNARVFMEDVDSTDLAQMYQDFIDNFVSEYIVSGLGLGEMRIEEFAELTSTMLTSMRYEVGEAKKTDKKEYEVPVVIQPSDVFVRYEEMITEDADKIMEKIKNGSYEGNDEEVQNQVLREVAGNAYDLLEKAYESSQYGEKQTVILRVKAREGDIYSIEEEDLNNLIVKILRLDEIGG